MTGSFDRGRPASRTGLPGRSDRDVAVRTGVDGSNRDVEIRTGVDVQSISPFREFDPEVAAGIKDRVFTEDERAYCERTGDPPQHYAVRWAAKEAFVKLLADDRTVPFDDIGVVGSPGRPSLELAPAASEALDRSFGGNRGPVSLDLSLSHDGDADVAVAQVVALGGGESR